MCQVHGRHEHVSLLYNLARDPGEETDVSGRHPEKVAALQERVTALLADMRTSYQPNRYRGACFCDTGTNILFGEGTYVTRPRLFLSFHPSCTINVSVW